jgi:hypothetical protein
MHFAAKHARGHGAADHRGSDVIQKARHHEHQGEQRESTFPVIRQQTGQHVRDPGLFEVPRQNRKAGEQREQVRQHHPLVPKMRAKGPARPRSG